MGSEWCRLSAQHHNFPVSSRYCLQVSNSWGPSPVTKKGSKYSSYSFYLRAAQLRCQQGAKCSGNRYMMGYHMKSPQASNCITTTLGQASSARLRASQAQLTLGGHFLQVFPPTLGGLSPYWHPRVSRNSQSQSLWISHWDLSSP